MPCVHIVKEGKHTMMLAPLGTPGDMRSVVVVMTKDELFAGQHPMGPMFTFVPDLYCHPPTGIGGDLVTRHVGDGAPLVSVSYSTAAS